MSEFPPEQPEHDLIEACKARYGDECRHYPVEDWTYLIASDGYRDGYWEWGEEQDRVGVL